MIVHDQLITNILAISKNKIKKISNLRLLQLTIKKLYIKNLVLSQHP